MTDAVQIITTLDSEGKAQEIARALVEKRLAACVQMAGPIQSTFRWKGAIETAGEWLCIIKTRAELYDKVEAAIREMHTYETPEIIALPIVAGSAAYLDWLRHETS